MVHAGATTAPRATTPSHDARDAWIGIDIGTQSLRVQAFTGSGDPIGQAAHPLVSVRGDGRHEQDPASWLAAARACLRRVTDRVRATGRIVQGVAVSGTSGTLVPVDREGRAEGMAVMYDDGRGAAHLDAVQAAGAEVWSRLGYRMQPSWALPKVVALCADDRRPSGGFAHQPDVLLAALAGRRVATDTAHALKTGADLDAMDWPHDVLERLGIDGDRLPALTLPGTVVGHVTAAAASETGLPAGCSLVAGMTDGCAAQIAVGALEPGDWVSVLGTTLVVKGAASHRIPGDGAIYAHRAPSDLGWWPGGASSAGAGVLGQWLPDADVDLLATKAAAVGRPPLAYPLVGRGERFPFSAPTAHAIRPVGSHAEVYAAVAVGVAAVERLSFDLLAADGWPTGGRRCTTGGGTRSRWWLQLRADLLRRSLTVPESSDGTRGMAMLAASGVRAEPLGDVATRMRAAAVVVDPGDPADWLIEAHLALLDRWRDEGWLPEERHRIAVGRHPITDHDGASP